jgi:murein L,D-transpeptidase YcbB/YkuD
VLAEMNPYDPQNVAAVEKLLKDEVNWVRLCAAGTVQRFGAQAKSAIPLLKEAEKSDDEQLKKAAADAITAIEAAKADDAAAKAFDEAVKKIAQFQEGLRK